MVEALYVKLIIYDYEFSLYARYERRRALKLEYPKLYFWMLSFPINPFGSPSVFFVSIIKDIYIFPNFKLNLWINCKAFDVTSQLVLRAEFDMANWFQFMIESDTKKIKAGEVNSLIIKTKILNNQISNLQS